MTTCKEHTNALIECARRGRNPDAALMAHLAPCAPCEERWQSELALTEQLRGMRAQAMAADVASQARRDLRAAALMREAARRRKPVSIIPSRSQIWTSTWALRAAAAILLAIGVGYGIGARTRHHAVQPALRTHGMRNPQTVIYEAGADLSGGDFIAIPYALPLVPGEIVDIEQSDLGLEDLASLGIDVDSDSVSADVVVGQDGFPRAVRITSTQF